MKRLTILGGRGMLGTDLVKLTRSAGYQVEILDLPDFDITDEIQLRDAVKRCKIIINCAAYTNVDQAEEEIIKCKAVNADVLTILGEAAVKNDSYVLHVSTDFVFGNDSNRELRETDAPSPLCVYGHTKLDGETNLQKSGCRCGIVRVEWSYGQHGNNFISKIIELTEKLDTLKVINDQFGSPTWTMDSSRAIFCCMKQEVEGIYHFAANGYASRFEVAKFILSELGIEKNMEPCSSEEFVTPARRPLNSRFDCSKIKPILDFEIPNWCDSLHQFLT